MNNTGGELVIDSPHHHDAADEQYGTEDLDTLRTDEMESVQ